MYFTGGFSYAVPAEFSLTYAMCIVRFVFVGYLISMYFLVPYSVITMAISVLLADFRFYLDFHSYINSILSESDEDLDE